MSMTDIILYDSTYGLNIVTKPTTVAKYGLERYRLEKTYPDNPIMGFDNAARMCIAYGPSHVTVTPIRKYDRPTFPRMLALVYPC